jgi:hypothetical protein
MKDGFESLGRVRLQGFALLAIVFVVGLLGGMAIERIRVSRRRPPPPTEFVGLRGDMPPGMERLNLTAEQRAQIAEIFRSSRPLTDSVLRSSMPRLQTIHDSVRQEIRAILTPEQQAIFDEMEPEGRWGPRGRGGPGGRAGPGRPPGGGPPGGGPPPMEGPR